MTRERDTWFEARTTYVRFDDDTSARARTCDEWSVGQPALRGVYAVAEFPCETLALIALSEGTLGSGCALGAARTLLVLR
jgi:hypothetical protein